MKNIFYSIILTLVVIFVGVFMFTDNPSKTPAQEQDATLFDTPEVRELNATTSNSTVSQKQLMPDIKTFNISGRNYKFSTKEIRVKKGENIRVDFKSVKGLHNFTIDEFGISTSNVDTGNETSVIFVADKIGVFEYYCSVGNHRKKGMTGKLIVEE